MQGTKKKSRLWSLKEIKKVAEIIESAMASGKSKMAAMDEAAAHFGVTRNAIHIRYGRYKKGESMTRVKRNTAKKPTKGVKRGPYGKRKKYTKKPVINAIIDDGGISRVKRKYTKRVLNFKEDKSPVAAAFAKRVVADSNKLVFSIGLLTAHVPKITAITVDFDTRSITYTY